VLVEAPASKEPKIGERACTRETSRITTDESHEWTVKRALLKSERAERHWVAIRWGWMERCTTSMS
jgi:hypothetical protein